jgi:hypothetical protein
VVRERGDASKDGWYHERGLNLTVDETYRGLKKTPWTEACFYMCVVKENKKKSKNGPENPSLFACLPASTGPS